MNKHILPGALAVMLTTLACGLNISTTAATQPDVATIVAATLQSYTAAPPAPNATPTLAASQQNGIAFSASPIKFVIPGGLANGAIAENMEAVTDQTGAPWEVAPAHLQITLQGYSLPSSLHVPQVFVYPATEYAAVGAGAPESLKRLQNILSNPTGSYSNDLLPFVPFFNAGQVFASQEKVIQFKDGAGLRMITQYAQDVEPINNGGLFYHFEGLSSDGKTYIIAILPVNSPLLAASNDPSASVPPDGIPFPNLNSSDPTLFENYFKAVTDKLNAAGPDDFHPSLSALDALIESITVNP